MKVTIKGKGDTDLHQRDFVAEGGQGKVYAKNGVAFKVYHDPSDMIPVGKIQELSALPTPPYGRPQDLLLDPQGQVIGYTSPFIQDAFVLCQLFPRSFRDREGVTHKHTFALAEQIRDGVVEAHKADVLIVDLNEMNFLVDRRFQQVTFIDTDSYQTRSYPATAIMESIRDRHMAHKHGFNEGTDWFSFAVVSFQLLTGIHPYKGKHPTLKGFDARMSANVSVLNPSVRVPKVAYDFSVIPKDWRAWYEAVLERGERCPPPGGVLTVGLFQPKVRTVSGSLNLILEEVGDYGSDVTGVWCSGSIMVVTTTMSVFKDGRQVDGRTAQAALLSPKRDTVVSVRHSADVPSLSLPESRQTMKFQSAAQHLMVHDNRLYLKNRGHVLEVVLNDLGANNVMATSRLAATVLDKASMLFPGGVYQDMLGSSFVSLFTDAGQTRQVRIADLDKYRVIDAKWDQGVKGGVLMVIGMKNGQYDRLIFRFDDTYQTYDMRKVEDVGQVGLNFVVTDAGVCVCLSENEDIELSSVRKGSFQVKVVQDKVLGGDMKLFKRGAQVLVARGSKVYTMKMK